ncbi:hypothetical protein OURE66S_01859 [Oligella ureolytica]
MKIDYRKRKKKTLDDVFDGPDQFGLLDVKPKKYSTSSSVVISNFQEVVAFIKQHGKLPDPDGSLTEKSLVQRLNAYIEDRELHEILRPYDRFNLLPSLISSQEEKSEVESRQLSEQSSSNASQDTEIENATSLDDILSSSAFAQFDQGDTSIFNLVNVSSTAEREAPDEIAQFRPCKDFYKFKSLFQDAHEGLKSGILKTVRFNVSDIAEGDLFIMEGVLCLIDEIGEYRVDNQGRYDPRLRVIFENGTESNHLLQSLARRLYVDETGRRVVRGADSVEDAFNNISHKDKRCRTDLFCDHVK